MGPIPTSASSTNPTGDAAPKGSTRRTIVFAALGTLIVVVACVTLFVVANDDPGPDYVDRATEGGAGAAVPGGAPEANPDAPEATPGADAVPEAGGRPGIIPDPNEGRGASSPEEPGGWMQLSLFALLAAALLGIGYRALRGGSTARANRAAWHAAAATGRDGAAETGLSSASRRAAEADRDREPDPDLT